MDLFYWLKNYVKHPLQLGAILPTSSSAARLIAKAISSSETNLVLELGAGTGTVTQALIRNGVLEQNLVLVEINREFCNILENKYPKAKIVCEDVLDFFQDVDRFAETKFDAIISGLPLLSIGKAQRELICDLCIKNLSDQGHFVQITYFLRCSFPASIVRKYNLKAKFSGLAFFNFPPAFVWDIRRNVL